MKFFVTGATGFVGSHFVQHALATGHEVRAIRRPGIRPAARAPRSVEWVDVELDAVAVGHLADCDALVHFAATGVSPKIASRQELMHWNVMAPQLLLERAHEAGVRRIIVAGSFAEYGLSADRYDLIPPDAPLLPMTSYASSKAACFVTCHATAVELNLSLCYLRIFSAFGDGQYDSNFWPALRRAALAGADFQMTAGEQIRDYVDVAHVAKCFLRAAIRTDVQAGQPMIRNIGSGRPVAMRDFAREWWQRWNASGVLQIGALPYRPNEIVRFAPLVLEEDKPT